MIFALAGNQNCGKTTLFNALTGSNQHVGNFPGVTVDQKIGEIKDGKSGSVVDLPGIYSLRPYTQEEIVTRDFILKGKPDGIINIVDATNIERNLYLTLQLLELRVPMVLALNMMDEVRANGGTIDVQELSHCLGIPVVPISAVKGEGVSELLDQAVHTARTKTLPKVYDFCSEESAVHRCIHAVVHMIQDHADKADIPARFATTKLIEGDENILQQLQLDQNEKELLEHCIVQMENESGLDRNAALADMRYSFIENVVQICVVKCHESKEHRRSVQMDKVLTGKYTALPVFFGVMLLIFYLTFNLIGQNLSDFLSLGIDKLTLVVDKGLTAYGINPVVHSLIIDGVFAGVGSVLSFLPIIVVLFFLLRSGDKKEPEVPDNPPVEDPTPAPDPTPTPDPEPEPTPDPSQGSYTEGEQTDGVWNLVLVNPWNPLPEDFSVDIEPLDNTRGVDKRCYPQLQKMMDDCRAAGYSPYICSSYRTQAMQQENFNRQVDIFKGQGYDEEEAQELAAREVAVPGTSEHQLGLAVDIIDTDNWNLDESQESMPTQQWLMANSWRYGFILRYPTGTTDITGIIYEPWHYRYVGCQVAKEIYQRGITLEEYLGRAEH